METTKHQSIRLVRLAAITAIIAGLAVRLYLAAITGLWGDEIFTVFWVKHSLGFLWGAGRYIEANPPLYYTLMWVWTRIFGMGELAMRVPTIMASAVAILAMYRLASRMFGQRTGLLAASIFAGTPAQIFYGVEARSYACQMALCLLILIELHALLSWRGNDTAHRGRQPWKPLCLYMLLSTTLIYTHYVQILFVAACGGAGLCMFWRDRNRHTVSPAIWIAGHAAIGLASLEAILPMLFLNGGAPISQVPTPGLRTFYYPITAALGIALESKLVLTLLFLGLVAACIACTRKRYTNVDAWIVIVTPAFFLALITLVSLWHSVFLIRVMSCLGIFMIIAIAVLLNSLKSSFEAALVPLALTIVSVIQPPVEASANAWRKDASLLLAEVRPSDHIVFAPREEIGGLAYYAPALADALCRYGCRSNVMRRRRKIICTGRCFIRGPFPRKN